MKNKIVLKAYNLIGSAESELSINAELREPVITEFTVNKFNQLTLIALMGISLTSAVTAAGINKELFLFFVFLY